MKLVKQELIINWISKVYLFIGVINFMAIWYTNTTPQLIVAILGVIISIIGVLRNVLVKTTYER